MGWSIVAFALGVLLGLCIGTTFAVVVVRRAIARNIAVYRDSENIRLFNSASYRDCTHAQIARMAIREAAAISGLDIQ